MPYPCWGPAASAVRIRKVGSRNGGEFMPGLYIGLGYMSATELTPARYLTVCHAPPPGSVGRRCRMVGCDRRGKRFPDTPYRGEAVVSEILEALAADRVLPVVVLSDAGQAAPLGEALLAGGLRG